MVEGKSALGTAVTTGEEKFPRTDESEKEVAKEANKTFASVFWLESGQVSQAVPNEQSF